jgi:DNA-binding NarL/FixJ family response regulator
MSGMSPQLSEHTAVGREGSSADADDRRDQQSASILVMDRRPLVRECLARCLSEELSNGRAVPADYAVDHATLGEFDLIVVGVGRLADEGRRRDEGQRLKGLAQSFPIVVISEDEDPGFVRSLMQMGVRANIPATLGLGMIVDILRVVRNGGTYFPSSIFDRAPPGSSLLPSETPLINVLTPRELDILRLLREGKPNKVIAYELDICDSTVKVHVRHIMGKLGATNRTQIALMAREMLAEGGY